MGDLSQLNPTKRFSGLEDLYAQYRPTYPAEAIDFIIRSCGLDSTTTLVDVGCGTGISTRLFAARGIPVIGVDPNDAMRSKAECAPAPDGGQAPAFRKGTGEATGLPDGSAAAVVAAQAFHWLNTENALREFCRILKPGGHVALMWNERDESDPFTSAYGAAVRSTPGAAAVEGPRARAGEALLQSPLFTEASLTKFANTQDVDEEGLIGRAFSASYAPREPATVAAFTTALRKVFADYQHDGRAALHYITSVYLARRK